MRFVKAGLIGMIGSLVMFVIMYIGIHVTGIAPFNMPPSAAFLTKFSVPPKPLALIGHFGYGAFWSIVLVVLFQEQVSIKNGLGLAIGLWLFMMIVLSPIIGWGFFGFGSVYDKGHELYLEPGPKYLILTLVLHLIYGTIIGWGNRKWILEKEQHF